MAEENKKKGNQINIELSEEISEGTYSNLAIISHSNSSALYRMYRKQKLNQESYLAQNMLKDCTRL